MIVKRNQASGDLFVNDCILRWQLPNEHPKFSASTANELRHDRYPSMDPEKLKAVVAGYSQSELHPFPFLISKLSLISKLLGSYVGLTFEYIATNWKIGVSKFAIIFTRLLEAEMMMKINLF